MTTPPGSRLRVGRGKPSLAALALLAVAPLRVAAVGAWTRHGGVSPCKSSCGGHGQMYAPPQSFKLQSFLRRSCWQMLVPHSPCILWWRCWQIPAPPRQRAPPPVCALPPRHAWPAYHRSWPSRERARRVEAAGALRLRAAGAGALGRPGAYGAGARAGSERRQALPKAGSVGPTVAQHQRLELIITTPEEQHCTSPLAVHCRARTTERQGSEQGWAFPTVAQSGAHAAAASLLRHRRGLCARKCGLAASP